MEPQVNFADPADVEKNKVMGILAYIIFFIPLIAAKESKFAMYHANQGLILFLGWIAIMLVGWIPIIGWLIAIFLPIVIIIFMVIGILNASKGLMKPLPLVGNITILK